jgi:hypothetical protein
MWRGAKQIPVFFRGPDKTAELRIEDITDRLLAPLPPIVADVVELAAYIYCADQFASRGGRAALEYGASWRRHLRLEMKVRCPDVWQRPEVTRLLASLTNFLSDDKFEFAFSPKTEIDGLDSYIFSGDTPCVESSVQGVMMFSGGLDSLSGAVEQILVKQKRIALVSHRSVAKVDGRQRLLVDELRRRCKRGCRPVHVPIWVHLHDADAREFTQRSRSFLFAALGMAVARGFDLSSCQFFENGVTSLNLPIADQLVGARASRTTHPRVLSTLSQLFSSVLGQDFRVESPFAWDTKTDIVAKLKAAGHADLIKHSVSCTRTRTTTSTVPHCGLCSQCVDRRFAVLSAGCEADDPATGYATELFTGARPTIEDKTMVERWVGTADRIDTCDNATVFAINYPQINDAIGRMPGSADENATKLFDLHKRHAGQVLRVLNEATGRFAAQRRRNELPESCLLNFVAKEASADKPRVDMPDPVQNGLLAKLAGLADADWVSRSLRAAIATAGKAIPAGKAGKARLWSHSQLRCATPHLPDGTLRSFLERSGFGNLSEPV